MHREMFIIQFFLHDWCNDWYVIAVMIDTVSIITSIKSKNVDNEHFSVHISFLWPDLVMQIVFALLLWLLGAKSSSAVFGKGLGGPVHTRDRRVRLSLRTTVVLVNRLHLYCASLTSKFFTIRNSDSPSHTHSVVSTLQVISQVVGSSGG